MRRIFKFLAIVFLTTFIAAVAVLFAAETGPVVAIVGDITKPERYTLEQLQKLPVTKITARDHNGTEAEYTGVSVEELLRRSGTPLGEQLRGKALATVIVVHAVDKYQAVFSLAELDSAMALHPALLAWSRNGEPLSASNGPVKLIVPDDKRQARWVRQVTAIEVVSINRPAITNAAVPRPTQKR